MSNDGEIEVGFGLDTSEAQPKLKQLKDELRSFNSEVAELAKRLQTHLDGVFKGMDRMQDKHLRAYRSALSAVGQGNRLAESSIPGFANAGEVETVIRNTLLRINTTMEQSVARVAEAHLRAAERVSRTSEQAMIARASKAMRSIEQMIQRESDAELQAAMRSEQRFRDAQMVLRNQPDAANARSTSAAARLRRSTAYWNDPQAVAADDIFRNLNMNMRQEQAQNTAYISSLVAQQREKVRRTTGTYGNDELVNARDSAFAARQSQFLREQTDIDLQRAKNLKRERTNENLKADMLDAERLGILDQKSAFQARMDRLKYGTPDYLTGQLRDTDYRLNKTARRADNSAFILARDTQDRQTEQDTIRRAEIGRSQYGMERTLDRLTSNGGADIMAIQTRILVGYQALATAFRGFQNMKQFVVDLDKEFRQFQAITSTTNSEMVSLKANMIEVSEATKFTALEVAQAATVMGQAGLSAREVSESIKSVTLLATAAGTDLNSAVDLVTSTMSIFNLQTSQSADIANTMTAAINGSKLTIDKLALGFQYAGNIAAQTGVTYQELTGIFGALANSGIRSGSTLGTGLRQLLIDLATPTKKFRDALDSVGLAESDVDVRSRGLVPVLKSLKEAGFGAGEAFESFEVRAAATFTALSNNIELAVALEKQFILSSAAAEANAIQMESFANTADKLKSVIGTLTYNAFTPFLEMLQDITNALADALSLLNKVPGALQALVVIGAGIGAAGILSLMAAVFGGISKGLPILSTFTGLMTGAIGVVDDFGVEVHKKHGILQALFATIKRHPYVALASAIIAAGTAIYTFMNRNKSLADQIDSLRGGVDHFTGLADEAREEAAAIDQVITNLIDRKAELDKDPVLREAKILEVVQQFKELGTQIDASTGSVNQLIAALNNIKKVDLGDQITNLVQATKGSELTLQALKTQEQAQTSNLNPLNVGITDALGNKLGGGDGARGNTPAHLAQLAKMNVADYRRYSSIASPNAEALIEMAFGQRDKPELQVLSAMLNDLEHQAAGTLNSINEIKNKNQRTRLEKQQLKTLEQQHEIDTALLARSREMLANVTSQASEHATIDANNVRVKYLGAEKFLNEMGIAEAGQRLEQNVKDKTDAAKKRMDHDDTTSEQAAQIAANLEAAVAALHEEFLELAEAARVKLIEHGLSPADAKAAVDNEIEKPSITAALGDVRALVKSEQEALHDIRAELNQKRQRVIAKQLSTAAARIGGTFSRSELVVQDKIIRGLFAEKRALIETVYKDELANAETRVDREKAEAKRADALDILREEEASYIDKISERRLKITEMIYNQLDDALDAEMDVVKEKMKTLAERIAKTRPGAVMDGLIEQYNTLLEQMGQLQTTSQINQAGLAYAGGGLSNPANVSASGAGLMSFFMGKGWSQPQAAGIVGNLAVESAFNPTAKGDQGKAFGLAQWHPDRQQKLFAFAKVNGMNPNELMTQAAFVDYELRNHETRAGAALMAARTPLEANNAMLGYERPSGFKWSDPTGSFHYDRRLAHTMAYAGGSYSEDTAAMAAFARDRDEKLEAAQVANARSTGRAFVRSSNASINGLLTQAKSSSSADSVLNLAEAANDIWTQIIAREISVFETENKKALAEGSMEAQEELASLKDRLGSERATEIGRFLEEYDRAALEAVEKPLKDAQRMLDEAQKPLNSGKYSADQLQRLQNLVYHQEQAVTATRVAAAEEKLKIIRDQLADATARSGENSSETIQWLEAEAQAERELTAAKEGRAAADDAADNKGDPLGGAIKSWKASTGWFDETGTFSETQQMQQTWGNVLNTLSSGFEQLFMNITSGTMSAGEAMRNFGLMVVQSFMGMIAKALAYQAVLMTLKALGGTPGGGGWFAKALSAVTGIKGAATGEMISTGIPNRDSTLRLVEPGEAILRKSTVDAIGRDNILSLNNMGNRRLSQTAPEMMAAQGGAGMVNVYVVSPDAVPPLGPNDIVAAIADNIQRKGPVRQLIKQVQMGAA